MHIILDNKKIIIFSKNSFFFENEYRYDRGVFSKSPYSQEDLMKIVQYFPGQTSLKAAEEMNEERKRLLKCCQGELPKGYITPLGITLTPSQKQALYILSIRKRLVLAMDMGLGKTIVALTDIVNKNQKALIVAPARILLNYKYELEKYFPGYPITILNKGGKRNKKLLDGQTLVCSYDMMKILYQELVKLDIKGIYFDECHFLANDSKRNRIAQKLINLLQPNTRVGMSGTIYTSRPPEFGIFRILKLISPFVFRMTRFTSFRNQYTKKYLKGPFIEYTLRPNTDFNKRIAPYIFRRSFDEEAPFIPKTRYSTLYAPIPKTALGIYKDLKYKYIAELDEKNVAKGWHTLKRLMLLNMICSGFFRNEKGEYKDVHLTKIEILKEFIKSIPQEQVLIVSSYRWTYRKIKEHIKDVECLGLLSSVKQDQAIKRFKDKSLQYLCIHAKSGGIGLDLPHIRYCVWIEPTYSGVDSLQTNARFRRLSTKGETFVYYILSEPKLIDTIMLKTAQGKIKNQVEFYNHVREQS